MRYDRILHTALAAPWSIQEEQLRAMLQIFARREAGIPATEQDIQAAVDNRRPDLIQMAGEVAVLPLYGVIFPKSNLMTEASGATSLTAWIGAYEELIADASVKAVVLDIDSPGGSTAGLTEAADRMRALAGQKPVVAVSNFLCASAAYFMAVQADQIVAAPSSITGSIGCIAIHENVAAALEAEGVDVTIISAGKYKAEGNPYEELGDEAAAAMQTVVNALYGQFVKAVAQGRGATESAVRNGYGQGRALTSANALAENLVDRVESIDKVVARLQTPQARSSVMRRRERAEDVPTPVLTSGFAQTTVSSNSTDWTSITTTADHTHVFRGVDPACVFCDMHYDDQPDFDEEPDPPQPEDIAAAIDRRMKEPAHV